MFFPFLEFPYILVSVIICVCPSTIYFSILPLPLIFVSIRKNECSRSIWNSIFINWSYVFPIIILITTFKPVQLSILLTKKQELLFFLINKLYSIHPSSKDVFVFVVFRYIPKFTFSELTYPFCPIFPCELSLPMFFIILEFPLILRSTSISECPLSMFFPILPLSYILVTIRRNECSLPMFFPILPFTLILRSTSINERSLPMFYSILEFPYILVPTWWSVCSWTIWFPIFNYPFVLIILASITILMPTPFPTHFSKKQKPPTSSPLPIHRFPKDFPIFVIMFSVPLLSISPLPCHAFTIRIW